MTQYESEFVKIPYYKLHPSYIPFVGNNYEAYRILQISESHYCEKIVDRTKYGIAYFCDWFTTECGEIEQDILGHNLTRSVCEDVMQNCSYPNFDNPLRSFCNIVLKAGGINLSKYNNNRQCYSHFAFMNFYQIPAFQNQGCFKTSYYTQAKREGIQNADRILEKWQTESTRLIDQVIEILEPRAIAFTSIDAWSSYEKCGGKYEKDDRIIRSAHPNRPWYNVQNSLSGKTGKQAFEEGLERIYGSL